MSFGSIEKFYFWVHETNQQSVYFKQDFCVYLVVTA